MTGSEAPRRLPTSAKLNLAALAILAGALVVHLWPEWSHDPDLSHGFLMPFASVLLIYLSRTPPLVDTLRPATSTLLATLLGAAALAGLWIAGLLALTLDWVSPIVDFALTSSFALLGCSALAAFADERTAVVPFNWASLTAALLWPLCSPLPPGTYTRLTLGLQLWVSQSVMGTLELLGVAAHRQGNIIELARGTVGIEEACSGVRSLISCVFAGVLFSAALARKPWARLVIIAAAAPLALAMNFIRSLTLTLLVNGGVRVEGAWHDLTGYAVLAVTAALLVWLATALGTGGPAGGTGTPHVPGPMAGGPGRPAAQNALAAVLVLAFGTWGFFAANTQATVRNEVPGPDLLALLPDAAAGWRVETTPDLYRFAGVIRTDELAQRTYSQTLPAGLKQVTLYLAYWPEGRASVGLVASHTPDACWPGSGWVPVAVADGRVTLRVGGRTLPTGQHRLFTNEAFPQHVWFWQLYDGHVVDVGPTRSVPALIGLALKYGFRRGGRQAFVRISSNRSWDEIEHEPFVADFFMRAQRLGLY